jgi:hypothetical protein
MKEVTTGTYVPGNHNATEENPVEARQNAYQHLRMEKLVAEVLLDFNWSQETPTPVAPASVAHTTMQYIHGGKFPQEGTEAGDQPFNSQWIVLQGGNREQKGEMIKDVTQVLLVFAVIYLVVTIVLLAEL